ncbi:hypothetical protein Aple_075020 [Acrocarpospora pleiomorpha]|uniref:Uncharacterized protein n=1 Tax=Acrocarpospora pleiomorpha TaxID=90975 RepID=A0A5M3XYS8_9ACTN|nr:hypothetical protein Aple_075020 [Acrocarpospora pleiomorpha]
MKLSWTGGRLRSNTTSVLLLVQGIGVHPAALATRRVIAVIRRQIPTTIPLVRHRARERPYPVNSQAVRPSTES